MDFFLNSSFRRAPQDAWLDRVALARVLLLPHARVDCALGRCDWLCRGLIVLQALVPHGVVVLAVVHRRLALLGIVVVKLARCPWHVVLGNNIVHAPKGGHANHCHGMGFVKLGNLYGRLNDENEVVVELCRKRCPKSVGLSGAILMMTML